MTSPLTQLGALAALQHDAAMAELARHNRALQILEHRISGLRQRRHTCPPAGSEDAVPLTLTSGHYDRWQRWVDQELTKLNAELACARARRDPLVQAARLAFGRKSATETLIRKEKQAMREKAQKRLEQSILQDQLAKNPLSF